MNVGLPRQSYQDVVLSRSVAAAAFRAESAVYMSKNAYLKDSRRHRISGVHLAIFCGDSAMSRRHPRRTVT
jgi:hypothetical protein